MLVLGLFVMGTFYAVLAPTGQSSADTGTSQQVEEGRALFAVGCASCHGLNGEGQASGEIQGPPLAGVGMTESVARNTLGSVKTFTSDFRAMKNVMAGRTERSLYKLVLDGETDVVVGVHMIGPDAPEILQAAAIAVKAKLKESDFDAVVALHPTMAEELVLMR